MKTLAMKILSLLMVMGCLQTGQAQDFKQAIVELQQVLKVKRMHVVMDISVFENAKSTTPLYQGKAEVYRDSSNYLYHYNGIDFLMNNACLLMVDKNEKKIMYRKRNPKTDGDLPRQVLFDIDSVLQLYRDSHYLGRENGIDHYHLSQKNTLISEIDLYVDSATKMTRKIQYVYTNRQVVRIHFDEFSIDPQFKNDEFAEHRYITIEKGKVVGINNFKGYQVSETTVSN